MNYFGHALVASWREAPPAIVLGAMLPDFSSMCRAKLAPVQDPEIDAGLALHHATDAAFHDLPAVVGLMRELDARLDDLGCARGPRRAVAHVGIELLLDGVLVDDAPARAAYLAGVACATPIAWVADGDARFTILRDRLRTYGVPEDLRSPAAITERLSRVLGSRPLLRPSPADLRAIHTALAAQQPRVAIAADLVLRGVRARLQGSLSTYAT